MFKFIKISQIIILALFILPILSGCGLQDKIKKGFNEFQESQQQEIINVMDDEKESSLSQTNKKNIDEWLVDNGLNRYGDLQDTMYAGGTPLFNEMTGESIDRFDYLLAKYPDLLEKIK